jgi:Flp pilus assembly secretin CpaC/cell division septation protein DedD
MKNILVLLSLLIFGVTAASPAFAQPARSAFAAVPVPGQPVAPTAPTPIPTPVTPQTPAVPRPGPATPAAPGKEEQLRIVADPATNSLIIYGTAQEFQNIKNILKDLDSVPRQVLMDVLVAEVTLTDTESFGIAYEIFRGNTTIFNRTFPSAGALVTPTAPTPLTDTTGTIISSALTGFPSGLSGIVGRASAIRAFINTLATQNRVRALASPSVLATDNRPARIQVGSEIPILTGQTSTFTGTATPLTSNAIQYRNTGVILTIIPQVNSQGLVNLQVKQEVSAVGQPNFGSTGSPSFSTRDAETTAVVQDGETLAIGGIIQEQKSRDRTGVPYLMDLPVVGRFFSTTSDQTDRTELVILITPHVVRNRAEARDVTEELKSRLSAVRNELERLDKERAAERAMQRPQPGAMRPDTTPPTPVPSVPTPAPAIPAPAPVAPVPGASNPVPGRAPGVSMAPANPTSVPSPQIAAAMPPGRSTPGPGLPPGASMAPANPPPVASPQVAAAMPLNNTNVVPAQPMPIQRAILSPPPQGGRAPEPEPQTDSGGTDRVGALLNSIETNGAESPNAANPAPAVKSAGQIWVVQVASFVTDKEAQTLASKLKVKGYDANVASAEVGGKTWYRVEVGRLASRNEARELQKNLQVTEKIEQSIISTR